MTVQAVNCIHLGSCGECSHPDRQRGWTNPIAWVFSKSPLCVYDPITKTSTLGVDCKLQQPSSRPPPPRSQEVSANHSPMSIAEALVLADMGEKVRRLAWNPSVYITQANQYVKSPSPYMLVNVANPFGGFCGGVMSFDTIDIVTKDWVIFTSTREERRYDVVWAMEQLLASRLITRNTSSLSEGYLRMIKTHEELCALIENETNCSNPPIYISQPSSYPVILFCHHNYRQPWSSTLDDLTATDYMIYEEKGGEIKSS